MFQFTVNSRASTVSSSAASILLFNNSIHTRCYSFDPSINLTELLFPLPKLKAAQSTLLLKSLIYNLSSKVLEIAQCSIKANNAVGSLRILPSILNSIQKYCCNSHIFLADLSPKNPSKKGEKDVRLSSLVQSWSLKLPTDGLRGHFQIGSE